MTIPRMNVTSFEKVSFVMFLRKGKLKSWAMRELIAHNKESAVDIIAARTAQLTKAVTMSFVRNDIVTIKTLEPSGITMSAFLASIPIVIGTIEKSSRRRPAQALAMIAVFLDFAEKKRCARSCSTKEKSIGINSKLR